MYNGYNNYNDQYNAFEDATGRREGMSVYLSKVFGWMFIGLLFTAFAAFYVAGSTSLIYSIVTNPVLFYGIAIAEILLVVYLSARITKMSYGSAIGVFLLYSILNGITLSVILIAFTLSSVAYTFAIASLTFGTMSLYGYVTKTDLTRVGNILFMGLIGLIILSLVNMFVNASSLEWVISILGMFVFLGLTAYDTQRIKGYYYSTQGNYEISRKIAIMGALQLYLDFINLFLIMLRLFGRRR